MRILVLAVAVIMTFATPAALADSAWSKVECHTFSDTGGKYCVVAKFFSNYEFDVILTNPADGALFFKIYGNRQDSEIFARKIGDPLDGGFGDAAFGLRVFSSTEKSVGIAPSHIPYSEAFKMIQQYSEMTVTHRDDATDEWHTDISIPLQGSSQALSRLLSTAKSRGVDTSAIDGPNQKWIADSGEPPPATSNSGSGGASNSAATSALQAQGRINSACITMRRGTPPNDLTYDGYTSSRYEFSNQCGEPINWAICDVLGEYPDMYVCYTNEAATHPDPVGPILNGGLKNGGVEYLLACRPTDAACIREVFALQKCNSAACILGASSGIQAIQTSPDQ